MCTENAELLTDARADLILKQSRYPGKLAKETNYLQRAGFWGLSSASVTAFEGCVSRMREARSHWSEQKFNFSKRGNRRKISLMITTLCIPDQEKIICYCEPAATAGDRQDDS